MTSPRLIGVDFMDECEKWRKIIHSLHLPEEVLDDDDAF